MGVYGTSTFKQGHGSTPSAHPAPATSMCTTYSSVSNGVLLARNLSGNASASGTVTNSSATPSLTLVTDSAQASATPVCSSVCHCLSHSAHMNNTVKLPTVAHMTIPASSTPSATGYSRKASGTVGRAHADALWQLSILLGAALVGMSLCF